MRVMVHMAFVDAQIALGDLGDAWVHATAGADDALAVGQPLGVAVAVRRLRGPGGAPRWGVSVPVPGDVPHWIGAYANVVINY